MIYINFVILSCLITRIQADCVDINGRSIAHEFHYVPGPDACKLCICDSGLPKACKPVLCAPPPDCQSFSRIGKFCCNFTCLDEVMHKRDEIEVMHKRDEIGSDLGLRLLASAVAVILSLSLLFFVVHRLRQRKTLGRQTRALRTERRGLNGLGYLTGSLGYLPENYYAGSEGCFDREFEFRYEEPAAHMSLWKPLGQGSSYYPRGEAPPPYEEAVSHPRTELTITASSTLPNISHRTIPLNLTAPGTIRIIHPRSRHVPDFNSTTLPGAQGKSCDSQNSTLHINISSCGFHNVPSSADGGPQISTSPEVTDAVISADVLYEDAVAFSNSPLIQSSSLARSDMVDGLGTSDLARRISPLLDHDDHDDYRSECENCKSSPGGNNAYYAQEEVEPPETMTLQRLPRDTDEEPYYRTSLTLPTHCRQPRTVLGSREGWFTSMPESSSEDD